MGTKSCFHSLAVVESFVRRLKSRLGWVSGITKLLFPSQLKIRSLLISSAQHVKNLGERTQTAQIVNGWADLVLLFDSHQLFAWALTICAKWDAITCAKRTCASLQPDRFKSITSLLVPSCRRRGIVLMPSMRTGMKLRSCTGRGTRT